MANSASSVKIDDVQLALNRQAKRKELLTQILPFSGLVLLLVLFSAVSGGMFLSGTNLENLINQCFQVTIVAVGAAFIYAAGMMDMSIGGVSAVAMLLIGILMRDYQISAWLAVLLAMVIATAFTMITALVHVALRVPVFVGSLCVMNICNGIAATLTSENEIYIDYQHYSSANSTTLKLIVLVVVFAVAWIIFNYTRLGKDLKALGGNPVSAVMSGVRRNKTIILAFVVIGCCLGLNAFFSLVRVGMASASSGTSLQMNIMTAVVLGGFPLSGGARSKMYGPIIGALTVTVLLNGIQLLGFDPAWGVVAKGALFLAVVGMTYERTKYVS